MKIVAEGRKQLRGREDERFERKLLKKSVSLASYHYLGSASIMRRIFRTLHNNEGESMTRRIKLAKWILVAALAIPRRRRA